MSLETIRGLMDEKYEVLDHLASGGVGDLYLVRHRHLEEHRVVKVLRGDLAADESTMRRFQQEARIATQIKHPNVAILYDYSRLPDGRYYMVWEHIAGEDLGEVIRDRGRIDPELAIELTIQALRGLDAIHSAGVIHRDISPDNLMLTRDLRGRPRVKIIDLGLVKNLREGEGAELTQAGTFLGKFRYCSPEQASPDEPTLDPRTDLYSLTQVLYEMLTGKPPFESESQHGFVIKRLTEDPIPLRRRSPELSLSGRLEKVVMRGLERRPDDRYPDAPTFIGALSEMVDPTRESGTAEMDPDDEEPRTGTEDDTPAPRDPEPRPGELTKEERLELLEQIDRAASKTRTAKRLHTQADRALREGRFEEARERIVELEETDPRHRHLPSLKERLTENEAIAQRRQKVLQAEQMLEKYLLERQQTLAGLALDTLLDLYPNHPKRSDYEAWVDLLGDEAAQQEQAEKAFDRGRKAIAEGELARAREALDEVETLDLSGRLAGTLLTEIQEAERGREIGARAEEIRDRLGARLEEGDLEGARSELERLEALEIPRVVLDNDRSRLREAELEARYRRAIGDRRWHDAREIAREMGRELPSSERPREMSKEISRLQGEDERSRSVEEGLATFRRYLEDERPREARMALQVLKNLAPNDPRVREAEQEL
ncbi:MAG: protein kinase [Thermoanaerobaculia bacterium]|nr:protein kinase [Thermoanaerobaculia bacterium]